MKVNFEGLHPGTRVRISRRTYLPVGAKRRRGRPGVVVKYLGQSHIGSGYYYSLYEVLLDGYKKPIEVYGLDLILEEIPYVQDEEDQNQTSSREFL